MYDVVIIGAGVVGCAVARYLSRYRVRTLVLEKNEDVCTGTSKANSAIVHAGFDAKAGTLMARMNVLGSRMMPPLSKELDFPFTQNGSLVVCMCTDDLPKLHTLYENGLQNGVEGLEIIDAARLRTLEPNISDDAVAALYAPTGGIVCPFLLTIALAENASTNGAEFRFDTEVRSVERDGDAWAVLTDGKRFRTRAVVNAAGVYSDIFHNMVSDKKLHITPRRGDYCLLDRNTGGFVRQTVFELPGKLGKGVLVSPTVHGNTIVGPTAIDIEDREGTNTTAEGISVLLEKAGNTVKNLPIRQVITSFAGLRAHEDSHAFYLGEVAGARNFFDCAGIESPGLSSAPAIGLTVSDEIAQKLGLEKNFSFNGTRKGILDPKKLTVEERNALIRENPMYGRIICRCESVSEGEIVDAIRRPLGAKSLDGVKRRTRAGMGRCQAGFCSPRVMEILARERNVPMSEITKSGGASKLIVGTTKDSFTEGRV